VHASIELPPRAGVRRCKMRSRAVLFWRLISIGDWGCGMKHVKHQAYLLAICASLTGACLDLNTQPAGNGGAGGAGGNGASGASGGSGGPEGSAFAHRYGDDGEQRASSVALAEDNSVFFTGNYNGGIFLGGDVGIADGNNGLLEEAFLAKLDRQGVPQWIVNPTEFKGTGSWGTEVVTKNGVVAWGGSGGDDPALRDMFIETRALGPDGAQPLAKTMLASLAHDELTGLALSNDGKTLYVAGVLRGAGSMYNGCPNLPEFDTLGQTHLVIFALDTGTLSCKWGKFYTGGNHNPSTIRVKVAPDGQPVIAGAYSGGTLDGTGFPLGENAFVMKLDGANGIFLAGRAIPNVLPLALTVDASADRIVIAGILTGELMFAGVAQDAPIQPADGSHIAIMAYDNALDEKWFRPLPGPKHQYCQSISTDGAGRLYAGCLHQGTLTMPNGPTIDCNIIGTSCGLLVPLASADGTVFGDKARAFGMGAPTSDPGPSFLTAAGANGLVVGGSWINAITLFDGVPLEPNGLFTDYDIVVSKVEPAP
jgi:hypothetical protein